MACDRIPLGAPGDIEILPPIPFRTRSIKQSALLPRHGPNAMRDRGFGAIRRMPMADCASDRQWQPYAGFLGDPSRTFSGFCYTGDRLPVERGLRPAEYLTIRHVLAVAGLSCHGSASAKISAADNRLILLCK
jgi:hypothetical protein